jgi:hypothetical protein
MSVAMAAFNGARYLPEQLATIAAQTTPPAELVVYDDGSSDDSPHLVSEFAKRVPFPVRLIGGSERVGSSVAFERAISACESDVVVLCDQDDAWTGTKLSCIAAAFEHDPSAVMAFSDGDMIDENGCPLGESLWQAFHFDPNRPLFPSLLRRSQLPGCTIAFRASLSEVALPIPASVGAADAWLRHDGWFALLAAATGPCVPVEDRLVRYRIHPGQQIGPPSVPRHPAHLLRYVLTQLAGHRTGVDMRRSAIDSLRDRLAATGRAPASTLRTLDDLRAHLALRSGLADARLRRILPVWREWRSGRYRRFSLAGASAVVDFLASGSS